MKKPTEQPHPVTQTWRQLKDLLNEWEDEALDQPRTITIDGEVFNSAAYIDHNGAVKDKGVRPGEEVMTWLNNEELEHLSSEYWQKRCELAERCIHVMGLNDTSLHSDLIQEWQEFKSKI